MYTELTTDESFICGSGMICPMDLYLAGAGGVGREALDVVLAQGRSVVAFLDDGLAGQTVRGLPVLAPSQAPRGERYLIAIADPTVRARLSDLLDRRGLTAVTLIHPSAGVGPETSLAAGCLVHANAYISSSVSIGTHCQVHYNATVGHDATLDDRVTIYPGANVAGAVRLATDVTVGSNAVVLAGITVGRGGFVGAGAVVTRDVGSGVVVIGSPARPLEK
jgi:sugar O-acyltransferase (sialic acid O-acetyltransferase NeuD family)